MGYSSSLNVINFILNRTYSQGALYDLSGNLLLKGTIDELLVNPSETIEDFVYVVLTDPVTIPYAMKRIRVKYPNAVSLTYDNILKQIEKKVIVKSIEFDYKNYEEQFNEFYNNVTESSLNEKQIEIMNNIIKKAVNSNETN